jgi:hypothetical protein
MEEYFVIVLIVSIAFTVFNIYFIFKILQFVIVATNLYRKIVEGQDTMVKILIDIRDNSKTQANPSLNVEKMVDSSPDEWKCRCGDINPITSSKCKKCGRSVKAII